ncbi:hypothetical protein CYMTET_19236 [Cymbomonas tetramitiformis]|uniref:Uncharacterized protein n=1 Tax=Cymbomonas tetramitiformis TaxID=36881 RepID=A0AAE0G6I0_9CHLO|nr:hypothetical protein CYMTET_19236 [Cymbomonas tetramitiformis]
MLVACLKQWAGIHASTEERLARLKEVLSLYVGTHPFHNFTKRKQYAPPPRTSHMEQAVAKEMPVDLELAPTDATSSVSAPASD